MIFSRRGILKGTGAVLATMAVPSALSAGQNSRNRIMFPPGGDLSDSDLFRLAERGVNVAMSAGAEYADVRITNTRHEKIWNLREITVDDEWFGIGVRVLNKGHWGFMSSAVLTEAEVERLAKGAVSQVEAYSQYIKGNIELVTPPEAVIRGVWTMPIKYDPFDVPKGEKMDFLLSVSDEVQAYDSVAFTAPAVTSSRKISFFASSNNSQWKQTTYNTEMELWLSYFQQPSVSAGIGIYQSKIGAPMGKGWEYLIDMDLASLIPKEIEELKATRYLTPVEINRYDAVLSSRVVGLLLGSTIGGATELDRALGHEANASGTSFLDSPLEMLGEYKLGNPALTVSTDRSMVGGLNTVKWDDEGVVAKPNVLVDKGILTDFQTTRETATHLRPYYEKTGRPVASNGSATSQSGLFVSTQHTSNLVMNPGGDELSFDDLVGKIEKGVALIDADSIDMDQQCLNGTIVCKAREIRKGRMERYISDAAIMIRAPEFWKGMAAIGGSSSQQIVGFGTKKGQPEQSSQYSVSAVPALFENIGMFNYRSR